MFIESSLKTHNEIIMEYNFKTLFKTMPGDMFNMSRNGRVGAYDLIRIRVSMTFAAVQRSEIDRYEVPWGYLFQASV